MPAYKIVATERKPPNFVLDTTRYTMDSAKQAFYEWCKRFEAGWTVELIAPNGKVLNRQEK